MIESLQMWIWNIGGCLFTITLFLFLIGFIIDKTLSRLSGFHKREVRENLYYWLKNKERLNKIINAEKKNKGEK